MTVVGVQRIGKNGERKGMNVARLTLFRPYSHGSASSRDFIVSCLRTSWPIDKKSRPSGHRQGATRTHVLNYRYIIIQT